MRTERHGIRFFGTVLLGLLVASVCATAALLWAATRNGPETVSTPLPKADAAPAAPRYVGAGSCSARACHGNPTLISGSEWNSAFAVWAENDPHSHAYSVLTTPTSKDMAQRLGLGNPWEEERCLACHSLPVNLHTGYDQKQVETLQVDGVSCEACHGAAENYLVAHTVTGWLPEVKSNTPKYGMKKTSDIAVRAKICAGCHVGEPEGDGWPRRDVNHDLIAAGHPRLSFELSAFMATMPPHWNPKKNPARFNELRSWVDGQFAGASAALRVLDARAKDVAAEKPGKTAVWPEFAEYDCYACHHDLNAPSWRHNPLVAQHHQPGTPEWGSWHYDGLQTLAETSLLPIQQRTQLEEHLKSIRGALQPLVRAKQINENQTSGGLIDAAARVAKETPAALAELDACRQALSDLMASKSVGPNKLSSELVKSLQNRFEQHKSMNWDEYAQYYLALVAINRDRALNAAKPGATKLPPGPADGILNDIRNLLSFSRTSNQTVDNTAQLANAANAPSPAAADASLRVLRPGVNSPQSFDPTQMRLQDLFQRAFQQLSTSSTPL